MDSHLWKIPEIQCNYQQQSLIDEITARNLAEAFSLTPSNRNGWYPTTAKRERLIDNIKYYLDELKRKKFRIADKIYFEIIKKEGEDTHQ